MTTATREGWQSARHRTTVYMILAIVGTSILFDGYDLVIYGAVLSTLLEDPSHIGELSPAVAGTLGSYAMIGMMVGALSSGAVGDRIGRRKVMLTAIIWFSVGMALTAMTTSIAMFGFMRFVTGLGVGMIVATGGAIIAEFVPAHRRNLFSALVYSGVPAGGVIAPVLAMLLQDTIGWRGLFLIGATPILFLLPMAFFFLPESPRWLTARGRVAVTGDKTGFAGVFSRRYLRGTILIGFMSFIGLLSTYGLNTWLPKIMQSNGATADDSLYSLIALNGSAVIGGLIASWIADRVGAKAVITTTFLIAAACLAGLPYISAWPLMYSAIALAGVGVVGTAVLIYGLTSNFFGTSCRAAGVAWCAGFGRLGGILGPAIGGLIIGAGYGPTTAFSLFAGAAVIGAVLTALIPRSPNEVEIKVESKPLARV